MNELQPVALGDAPADLVVRGGEALRVEAGTFAPRDVAVVGDRVAALLDPAATDAVVGRETTVVDATDRRVVPGFVDAHTHLDAGLPFERVHHRALQGGTTTVVSETNAVGSALGARGVEAFLDATADLPVDVFATVAPQPLFDLFEPRRADDEEAAALRGLLDRDRVVGVGELSWIYVVGRSSPVEALVERARELGAVVTGHGAGCSGAELDAFATVVDDDHEPVAGEEFLARVERGVHGVGRFGSRDDVPALVEAYREVGPAFSLSSDVIGLDRLAAGRYMDRVVERLREEGVPLADAVRMATLEPARHFGLDDRGSLAPGRVADVVVLAAPDDDPGVAVDAVVAGGEVVVRDGEPLVGPRPHDYPPFVYDTVDASVAPETFRVPTDAVPGDAVRAIDHEVAMRTAETVVEPPVVDGQFRPDPDAGLLKAAAVDRRDGTCRFTGFLAGLGLREGAVATTSAMQLPAVVVVGADEADMATAVDRVAAHGGGWVAVRDGRPLAEAPAPVAGCSPEVSLETALDRSAAVTAALGELGGERSDVRVGISSLVFTGVPALKLSHSGYADVLDRTLVGLAP